VSQENNLSQSEASANLRALEYVTAQGAKTRKNKYSRDLNRFWVPVFISILVIAIVYIVVTTRPGRDDWFNIWTTVAALALVPAFSAFVLTAFRRHESPIVSSALVTLLLFSVAVSVLSAFRISISFVGLVACVPFVMAIMAYANIRFHRTSTFRVALAPFARAEEVLRLIGPHVPLLPGPDADLEDIDVLLVDPAAHHTEEWSPLLSRCYLAGIEIMPWSHYVELWHGRLNVDDFDISHIYYTPTQMIYARAKHLVDLVVILLTAPITLPLALLVAAYVFLRDGGPVFFVQMRRGFGGRAFKVYKFRTMYRGTAGGATAKDDKRIIPGGRFLRNFRLDELPQLYNILRGEMSLIGPRPEALDLSAWYEREIPKYTSRLLVLPGITGWAQVNYGYTSNPDEALEKLSLDLYYIKHLSLDLDILILFKTFTTVVFGSGAR
jgi:UDP-GalNAc:undecaprenyl-phosphate GalNAc-1-phosphate transferase